MNIYNHTHISNYIQIVFSPLLNNSKITSPSPKNQNTFFFYNHPIYRGTMGPCYIPHIANGWDTEVMLQLPFPDWEMDMSTMMCFTLQNFSYKCNSLGEP